MTRSLAQLIAVASLGVAIVLAGCGDEKGPDSSAPDGPIDALIVVQETNLGGCAEGNVYTLEVTRECDGQPRQVTVCSEVELCGAQVDDLAGAATACDVPGSFSASTTVACP